jgi:ATP-dependent protease ClpP protease subunit
MARRTRHAALVDSLCGRLRAWTAKHAFASRERDPEGRTWYRIENAGPTAAATTPVDVFIYGEIGFWGVTAEAFLSDLGQVGSRDITLRINSEGGEVFDGVAIYNALQRHPGRIEGHVDGLAASAASFIAMACDELIVEPGAQLMIHDAIGMCYGNAAEMTKMVDMLHRTSDTIAAIYAERAGGEAADWRARMAAEDTWYDGPAAVAAGLADRVGEARERRPGPVEDASRSKVTAYYGEAPGERDSDGRFKDGMPDVVASYVFATVSGALTAARTRDGVELSDGANSVTVRPHEARRIERAMRAGAVGEVLVNRNTEIDGKLHVVTVARVRPTGRGQNEDGENVATGMRLDIGEVQDSDDYDARTGVTFTDRQADEPFATTLGNAEVAARVQTGYGPLDMYPTADGRGMTLRMKAESGHPTEVEFSRAEWQKINTAINTLIDGFGEDTPEGVEVNAITVPTKAGKVDLEWKGGRSEGGGYPADARLLITPQYDAPWSVVIGGEHMSDAFDPIGFINTAIGIDNRAERLAVVATAEEWAAPEWAAAHSTPDPVSSSISDHRSLWEAWA